MFACVVQRFRFSGGSRILPPLKPKVNSHLFRPTTSSSSPTTNPSYRRCLYPLLLSSVFARRSHSFLLALLCSFCQLEPAAPFGSRLIHSFRCPSFNTNTRIHYAPPPSHPLPILTQPLHSPALVQHLPIGTVGKTACCTVPLHRPAHRSVTLI